MLFDDVPDEVRQRMRRVGSKDTAPEKVVRRLLWSLGFRYRLYQHDLPGKPDIVFKGRRKVIFVHGCFWHRHPGCRRATFPKAHSEFWKMKFDATVERDKETLNKLEQLGWSSLVVWECETKHLDPLALKLKSFLEETFLTN